jgi:hypothetical protein
MPDSFEVRLLDAAKEDIAETADPARLLNKIEELKSHPTKRGTPLSGDLAGYYSFTDPCTGR